MIKFFSKNFFLSIASIFLALSILALTPKVVQAYNNPDLLPEEQTPIIDLARSLTEIQENLLAKDLEEFETETGWKLVKEPPVIFAFQCETLKVFMRRR